MLCSCSHKNLSATTSSEALVGDGIAQFIPVGYDVAVEGKSLILKDEPKSIGNVPADWNLIPEYVVTDSLVTVSVPVPEGTDLYGGGEVTGPLRRNGQAIKLWNTDTGMYLVENGKRLYQTHPWVMGLRPDGSAFGVLFDTYAGGELITDDDAITLKSNGTPAPTYIIDRESPQEVLKGLAELTGTISMPPLWSIGFHQSRFDFSPENWTPRVAKTYREKQIPCDVMWFDIAYMDGFRIFTIDPKRFPDPKETNKQLHDLGFHTVWMIDPGVKVDSTYFVYNQGNEKNLFVLDSVGNEFHGTVWPGDCAFPDFTMPEARKWWGTLYKDFLANGIDGVWNDMNEPSVFNGPNGTMPVSNKHRGGDGLPAADHAKYHNAFGRLMVEASYDGMLAARPEKRPFLLSRSNTLGGQRYAATWTGDNASGENFMRVSIPMSLTLGLSGQPFNGPDIGGFADNADPDIYAKWMAFGAFFPFARAHASCETEPKEPWAYGEEIELNNRIALERRYRLMPYLYTAFYQAHNSGLPVMQPVFMADPADKSLRSEEEAFLLGDDILVIPNIASEPALPKGIWEDLSIIDGENQARYQAKMKIRGGSIIPMGRVIQNLNENPFEPLTLAICLDENGKAEGQLYWDEGDGWSFRDGNFALFNLRAEAQPDGSVLVTSDKSGSFPFNPGTFNVEIYSNGSVKKATASNLAEFTVK